MIVLWALKFIGMALAAGLALILLLQLLEWAIDKWDHRKGQS